MSVQKRSPKNSGAGKKPGRDEKVNRILNEVLAIIFLLIFALLFAGCFTPDIIIFSGGAGFLKRLLGFGGYALPVFASIYCVWEIVGKNKRFRPMKVCGIFLLVLGVSMLSHLAWGAKANIYNGVPAMFEAFYKTGGAMNGGGLGGLITVLLIEKLTFKMAVLVIIIESIISLILFTGKSFFAALGMFFSYIAGSGKRREQKIKAQADKLAEDEGEKKRIAAEERRKRRGKFNNILIDDTAMEIRETEFKKPERDEKAKASVFDYSGLPVFDDLTYGAEGFEPIINGPLENMEEERAEERDPPVSETKRRKTRVPTLDIVPPKTEGHYIFPTVELLTQNVSSPGPGSKEEMLGTARKLEETLLSFGVLAKVVQINRGPTVTRYELSPSQGVKVSKIVGLSDDIALNLAAQGIRIEAPIPGKAAVGIEVPNSETRLVLLRDVIDTENFRRAPSKLSFALGQDIAGNAIVTDIAKMPHLLIAGATGSGKSVCINSIILSLLYKAEPKEVKLILVDPKVVELSVYNGIPHLLLPVVTDPKKAAGALNWAVREMLSRYQKFAERGVRDITGFNKNLNAEESEEQMPQIVIIVDELADLMMAAPGEVEDSICRLAQMARAAGIHLIIATQRPSVDVITGVIKANIPSRLAFSVSSGVDSRTILDMVGAEKLLGKGDMLFYPVGVSKPLRIQGAFVDDKEVETVVEFIKKNFAVEYDDDVINEITSPQKNAETGEDSDEFYQQAVELVVEKEKASASMLQRQFRIGYNRAARLIEELESRGVVGPEDGSKPRRVLMSKSELYALKNKTAEDEEC